MYANDFKVIEINRNCNVTHKNAVIPELSQ